MGLRWVRSESSKKENLIRRQLPVLWVLSRRRSHSRRHHPLVMALVGELGVPSAVHVLQRVVLYMAQAVHCIERALRVAARRTIAST